MAQGFKSADLKYLSFLLALILLIFLPNLILMRPVLDNPMVGDVGDLLHPAKLFASATYKSGQFPLWNPHDLCGMPFLAFPHLEALYPPAILYLLSFPLANTLSVLLHLILAGVIGYFFFRSLDFAPPISFILALSWSLSGMLFRNINFMPAFNGQAWVLLFFLAAFRLAKEFRMRWVLLFIVGYALTFLAGDHESLIYSTALLFWFAWSASEKNSGKILVLIAICILASMLLVFAQFVPLLEFFSQSIRGQAIFKPLTEIPLALIPALIPLALLFLCYQVLVPLGIYGPLARIPLYLGFIAFLGVLVGLFTAKQRLPRRLRWFSVVILAYAFIFTQPHLRFLVDRLPIVSKLLSINAILTPLEIYALIMAGYGLRNFWNITGRGWKKPPYIFSPFQD